MFLSSPQNKAYSTIHNNKNSDPISQQFRDIQSWLLQQPPSGVPNCHLHRIQLVLNAAARLLYRGQKKNHITPLLRGKLHWLPIAARIQFKISLLTYKSLRGLAPQYIADFLKPVASVSRRSTLRSASNESLIIPSTKTAFGTRSFSVAGPTYWNQLPETVKNAPSVNTFKRRLKTYLFQLSYFHKLYSIKICTEPLPLV